MTACDLPCCRSVPARTVSDLFDRGYRRSRNASIDLQGPLLTDANGLSVRFAVSIADGVVPTLAFKASTCVTLIAYCELIAELLEGRAIATAGGLSPQTLIAALPGVPTLKRDRAKLAVHAFRAALAASLRSDTTGENRHEGRLYLCHPAP